MAGKFDERLGDYVEVKDRIALFYAKHPDGRLVTSAAGMTLDPDGVVRVWCSALAYRTPDDPHPGTGTSYLVVPGSTPYTRGSEVENAETSAWGRAIGCLGIGIDKGIASAQEVRTKAHAEPAGPKVEKGEDGSLVGAVEVGDKRSSDFMLRQTPNGSALGFRLRGGRGGILVETRDGLAEQLNDHREAAIGAQAQVWGKVEDREFTPAGKPKVTYQAMVATRVRLPGGLDLPEAPTSAQEAPSAPMFGEVAQAPAGEPPRTEDAELDALSW
jgi:hypothetical protein